MDRIVQRLIIPVTLSGAVLRLPAWFVKARLMPLRGRQSQGVTNSVLALPGAPTELVVLNRC